MKLVELKDLKPLKETTKEEVKEFLDNHVIEMLNYMNNVKEHPMTPKFLHVRQIGLDYNIIVSVRNRNNPVIYINPKVIVRDEKTVDDAYEVCANFTKEDYIKRVFKTRRASDILLTYDVYEDEKTSMKKDNESFTGEYAILIQQLVDISNGKLITRFEEVTDGEQTEEESE